MANESWRPRGRGFKKNQKDSSLVRQIERLKDTAKDEYGVKKKDVEVFNDIGSGLSFTRKGLSRLVEEILAGKWDGSVLLVTHKDRLARFGTELFLQITKAHGIKVRFTEKELGESEDKELADDLISVITCFSARVYGARGAKACMRTMDGDAIKRAKELIDGGQSIRLVADALYEEGHRNSNGDKITTKLISRCVVKQNATLCEVLPTGKNHVEEYVKENVVKTTGNARIASHAIYQHYCEWCRQRGLQPVVINRLSTHLKRQCGYSTVFINRPPAGKGFAGIKVRDQSLEFYVKERRSTQAAASKNPDSFLRFYDEQLKGQWKGYLKEMGTAYKEWCQERNLVPLAGNRIKSTLRMIGCDVQIREGAMYYDLTCV